MTNTQDIYISCDQGFVGLGVSQNMTIINMQLGSTYIAFVKSVHCLVKQTCTILMKNIQTNSFTLGRFASTQLINYCSQLILKTIQKSGSVQNSFQHLTSIKLLLGDSSQAIFSPQTTKSTSNLLMGLNKLFMWPFLAHLSKLNAYTF